VANAWVATPNRMANHHSPNRVLIGTDGDVVHEVAAQRGRALEEPGASNVTAA